MHTNQLRSRVQVPAAMAANQGHFYDYAGSLSTTLELRDCPIPQPQDGDIILKLVAAALNPVDEQMSVSVMPRSAALNVDYVQRQLIRQAAQPYGHTSSAAKSTRL